MCSPLVVSASILHMSSLSSNSHQLTLCYVHRSGEFNIHNACKRRLHLILEHSHRASGTPALQQPASSRPVSRSPSASGVACLGHV